MRRSLQKAERLKWCSTRQCARGGRREVSHHHKLTPGQATYKAVSANIVASLGYGANAVKMIYFSGESKGREREG